MAMRLTEEEWTVLAGYVAQPKPIRAGDYVAARLSHKNVLAHQAHPSDIHGSRDDSSRLYAAQVIPVTNGCVPLDVVLGVPGVTIESDPHRCALWRQIAQDMKIATDPKHHAVPPEQKTRVRHKSRDLNVAAHNGHLPEAILEYFKREHEFLLAEEARALRLQQQQLDDEAADLR